MHCKTLFGNCVDSNRLPPPATDREKEKWNQNAVIGQYPDSDSSSNESDSSNGESSVEYSAFLYPGGPGHRQESSQTLAIMWCTMKQAGVQSFPPDLGSSFNSPNNKFLWDFEISLFIKLIHAHEYTDIDLEMYSEQEIYQIFCNHVKSLWQKYRKENMDPEMRTYKAKYSHCMTRLANNHQGRIAYLLGQPSLTPFIPIVQKFTSNDKMDQGESDESETEEPEDQDVTKKFLILHMPWCHPQVTRIIRVLDKLIACKKKSSNSKGEAKSQRTK
ncbi:hypothetical protein O181_016778 [Austropuccinia psidii MF-1]|uniref:Uncharacterized protein n=1 Tax=Austropuccinia psidii MF-1 TaxID=1389203 RepID=A0A9Q3C508_9BASI|nr:hypothetical protein [Austropuccinia psidii MF-1]